MDAQQATFQAMVDAARARDERKRELWRQLMTLIKATPAGRLPSLMATLSEVRATAA